MKNVEEKLIFELVWVLYIVFKLKKLVTRDNADFPKIRGNGEKSDYFLCSERMVINPPAHRVPFLSSYLGDYLHVSDEKNNPT